MRALPLPALAPSLLLAACTPADATRDVAPVACPDGEVADDGACVPEECGRGPWGNVEVDADTVYVQAGATGDGSAQAPFGTIGEGADLAGAQGGGRVVIAAGTYTENLTLGEAHRDVTLAGRCRALVTLDGSAGRRNEAALLVQGEARRVPLVVSDLTVSGGPLGGLAFAVARAEVRRVEVRENARSGVMVYDAEVLLDDVAVNDTRAGGDSRVGAGVEVQIGSVEMRDVSVSGSADEAVHVQGPRSRATLTRVRVVDNGGYGLSALAGGDIVASEVELAGNTEADIVVNDAGSTLALSDSTVRGSRPEAARTKGVSAQGGAELTLERVLIEGPSGAGVLVGGDDTTIDLVDVTVQGHTGSGADGEGAGVIVRDGATLTGRGLRLLDNGGIGLGVEGGEARLVDSEIRGNGVRGADVIGGGLLTLTDSRVLDNTAVGIFLDAPGSRAEVAGSTVSGTSTDAEGLYGQGVIARDGASLVATGSSLSGNTHAACTVAGAGASAVLTDVALDDTRPDAWGTAASLVVMEGARAEVTGGTAQRGRHAALAVLDEGSELVVEGLRVADIGPERAGIGGFGVVVGSGAHARLTDVELTGTMGAGVLAQDRGSQVMMLRATIEDTGRNRDVRLAAGWSSWTPGSCGPRDPERSRTRMERST